jgi:hypothetical protein
LTSGLQGRAAGRKERLSEKCRDLQRNDGESQQNLEIGMPHNFSSLYKYTLFGIGGRQIIAKIRFPVSAAD